MKFSTRPITKDFGVEVLDVDLREAEDSVISAVLDHIARHELVLFRRQCLNDAELTRLAKGLGPVGIASKKTSHAPGHPEIMYVSNLHDTDGRLIGGMKPGDLSESSWHSDQAFRERPATLSILYSIHPPEEGGETSFTSTRMGYEALPETLKSRLQGLRARYQPVPAHEIEIVEVTHPAVLENPLTGRKSVYLSEMCLGFVGVEDSEGQKLKAEALSHVMRADHAYSHRWRMGDMVLYDNAQLLHRREAFNGLRWLKASRSYAPLERFAQP